MTPNKENRHGAVGCSGSLSGEKTQISYAVNSAGRKKPTDALGSPFIGDEKTGEFAGKFILHEVCSPLSDMLMFIQSQRKNQQTEPVYKYLSYRIKTLLVLLDGLAKNNEGADQRPDWLDPDEVICDLIKNMADQLKKKKLKVSYSCEIPPNSEIKIDLQAFLVLARNLLDNAVRHTHSGDIKIYLKKVSKKLNLIIQDSGEGLPLHYKEYLENPEAKAELPAGNHGMGLILVHESSRKLDATITVQDKKSALERRKSTRQTRRNLVNSGKKGTDSVYETSESPRGASLCVNIPGSWRLNKTCDYSASTCANLAEIAFEDPSLYRKLLYLRLNHPTSSAKFNLELKDEPVPHLHCTDLLTGKELALNWPCSYKELRNFLESLEQSQKESLRLAKDRLTQKKRASHPVERIALIIDDSKVSQAFYSQTLQAFGWLTQTASDARSANRQLNRVHYDLIIRDALLDGTIQPTDIPTIATSAVEEFAQALCRTPGRWLGVLLKPPKLEQVSKVLQSQSLRNAVRAWSSRFGAQQTDTTTAVNMAELALAEIIASWRLLQTSIACGDLEQTTHLVHRTLGGLRCTGLMLLREEFEQIYQALLSRRELPDSARRARLKRLIRQSWLILKQAKD